MYNLEFQSNSLRFVEVSSFWCPIWQYGLWSFQTGGTKLERFLPKNQHTQRKLLNVENWVSGEGFKSWTSLVRKVI